MFDFTGKVVWVFLIAAFITTGTLALSADGNISFNAFRGLEIVWRAFVELGNEATGEGGSDAQPDRL